MSLGEPTARRARSRPARRDNPWSKLVTGATILAIGVIFWLDKSGQVDAWELMQWWPVVLIAAGLATLAERQWLGAAILIALGLAFLPSNPYLPEFGIWHVLASWPLLITAAGITLIGQALRPVSKDRSRDRAFRSIAVMAGNQRRIAVEGFTGGEAIAVMGGCEIDLTESTLADDAVIDVLAFWGGVDIRVPRGWRIENRVLPLLGALTDNTRGAIEGGRSLTVRGSVIMGAVEVKNAKEPLT